MNAPCSIEDALRALTNGVHGAGIDWAELDAHRLMLGEFTCTMQVGVTVDQETADAIEGIVSCLDWLTDAAAEAGLLTRNPPTNHA